MVQIERPLGRALAVMLGAAALSSLARAQDAVSIPQFTVTADRVEEPLELDRLRCHGHPRRRG